MFLIVIFGFIGLLVGGFRGLIVGAALGYLLRWALRRAIRRGLGLVQSQFLDSTFAVMGALCKADSVVTRDEIRAAETLFTRLRLSEEQRGAAIAAFNRGKAAGFDLDAEVAKLARVCRGRRGLLQMFLQVQLMVIAADGRIDPAEHEMLVRVARGLGFSEADVAQLEALLRANAGQPSPRQTLEDAYAALGVTAAASDADIKRTYRRLMSENHPDKLAGKGLPESMREMAEERTREISTAYALIKEARQLA
jgi:DnaJ like chaperone protein